MKKLPELVPMSVAENGGQDHIMAAQMEAFHEGRSVTFYMGFDDLGNVTLRKFPGDKGAEPTIRLPAINIDSMILFLQEAKEFIAEAETYRILSAKKR